MKIKLDFLRQGAYITRLDSAAFQVGYILHDTTNIRKKRYISQAFSQKNLAGGDIILAPGYVKMSYYSAWIGYRATLA